MLSVLGVAMLGRGAIARRETPFDLIAPHTVHLQASMTRGQVDAHATADTLPAQADLIAPLSILGTVTMTRAQTAAQATGDII